MAEGVLVIEGGEGMLEGEIVGGCERECAAFLCRWRLLDVAKLFVHCEQKKHSRGGEIGDEGEGEGEGEGKGKDSEADEDEDEDEEGEGKDEGGEGEDEEGEYEDEEEDEDEDEEDEEREDKEDKGEDTDEREDEEVNVAFSLPFLRLVGLVAVVAAFLFAPGLLVATASVDN
jgi:hypothetical protein